MTLCSALEVAIFIGMVYGAVRLIEPHLKQWRNSWWRKKQARVTVSDWRLGGGS